ncbi:MAG: hypothetical protein KDD34_08535 [Bdellovibrionales bacterium]|nr:hypothetical protein [Bdellovibrionales bacterium]
MNKKILKLSILLLALFNQHKSHAINFQLSPSEVDETRILTEINLAKTYLSDPSIPDTEYVVEFPAGSYFFKTLNGKKAIFEFNNFNPLPGKNLIFRGKGMNNTRLEVDVEDLMIHGLNVSNVKFQLMELAQDRMKVSQGTVVNTGKMFVDIIIDKGFPSPDEIYDPLSNTGRYLRLYNDSGNNPIVIQSFEQEAWLSATLINNNQWRFFLASNTMMKTGDRVGIKSKMGEQAYFFDTGRSVYFENIRWVNEGRGVFRNFHHAVIRNCQIRRPAPINGVIPFLSTSSGGPQIGQPKLCGGGKNHLIENNVFIATGDDSIGLFNLQPTSTIKNNRIISSFGRGILNYHYQKNIGWVNSRLINNTLINNPLLKLNYHHSAAGVVCP